MATLRSGRSTRLLPSILLSEERHASRFQFKASELEWLTNAAHCRCDSVRLWLSASRHGSFGRTSLMHYRSTTDEHLPPSFAGWSNAGIAVPGAFWTLATLESPSVAADSSLSAIVDRGNEQQRRYLTAPKIENLLRRLSKYGKHECELAKALRQCL